MSARTSEALTRASSCACKAWSSVGQYVPDEKAGASSNVAGLEGSRYRT